MTALVWANVPLALLFTLAVCGIPLWMTFKRPQVPPDHSGARAYLRAKQALAGPATPGPDAMTTARLHATAGRRPVPGHRHAGPERAHPAAAKEHTGTPQ